MSSPGFVWPDWVSPPHKDDDPKRDAMRVRTRFLLRVAALHATEEGTLAALSVYLGLHPSTLGNYASRMETVSPELAERLEIASSGVCRAHYFRPDVFPPSHKARLPKK